MADGGRAARYVAIITDGNGRWAAERGLPVIEGHRAGADVVKARLKDAADLGVRELTVYSFSTENWSRPPEEVAALMAMFAQRIRDETPELRDEGVRMRFIGRRDRVSADLVEQMEWAEEETRGGLRTADSRPRYYDVAAAHRARIRAGRHIPRREGRSRPVLPAARIGHLGVPGHGPLAPGFRSSPGREYGATRRRSGRSGQDRRGSPPLAPSRRPGPRRPYR